MTQSYPLIEGDIDQSGGHVLRKTHTFQDAAGEGAVGTVNIFKVTGAVRMRVAAYCSASLAGASATIELGGADDTDEIIPQTTATDLDADDVWASATPAKVDASLGFVDIAEDVIVTVGTQPVTGGTIVFKCEWEAITEDGLVEAY